MDSLLAAAARALARGDPLGALRRVALRSDAHALALRGIAMAQLGDLGRARELLVRAERAFGRREAVARARCVVARFEVALAARELGSTAATRALEDAARTLEARGDTRNAEHARLVLARRALLFGQLDRAERVLDQARVGELPPMLQGIAELCRAEVFGRRVRAADASQALDRAAVAAATAGIPALLAEVERAREELGRPAARRVGPGGTETLRLDEVERLLASGALVVDGCRRSLRQGARVIVLARRPVLFALLRALAEAAPSDVDRLALIEHAFQVRRPNESHRARLRVEMGRLRREIGALAEVEATPRGFVLRPRAAVPVVVLAPPLDGTGADVLALLAAGDPWSTSSLSLALGRSQRSVQRALAEAEAEGRVAGTGRARARRWMARGPSAFATPLLLPVALPGD
jgi:hypothetical protein